jgi:hypothetical protein
MRSSIPRKTRDRPTLARSLDRSSRMKLIAPEITSATARARSPLMGVTTWMRSQTAASSATRRAV